MEPENHKVVRNFLRDFERESIVEWVNGISFIQSVSNSHIKEVRRNLNGNSYMYDISKTPETSYISNFQSGENIIGDDPPKIILDLVRRISESILVSDERVFLQVLDMNSGGRISPHYDSAIDGYINYKCNISVLSEKYDLYLGDNAITVDQGDLYCFEASLYRHWTEKFRNRRILLSFGFVLPYGDLGRDSDDPRVRMSRRIVKYFQ